MNPKKFLIDPNKPFFIYDTRGDWHATKIGDYIYDLRGDYIGFVRGENYDVYTAIGQHIGNLWPDGRIIRKRNPEPRPLLTDRPPRQPRLQRPPIRAPLPPLTGELGFDKIDVLEWDEEIFKNIDAMPDLD